MSYFFFRNQFAVGAEVDDERIELLLSSVKGKDVTELIASGREKLASVPSGGGAAMAVAAGGGGGGGGAAPAAEESKKEEKVEEKEESDDVSFVKLYENVAWNCHKILEIINSVLFGKSVLISCLIDVLQDMGFSLFD